MRRPTSPPTSTRAQARSSDVAKATGPHRSSCPANVERARSPRCVSDGQLDVWVGEDEIIRRLSLRARRQGRRRPPRSDVTFDFELARREQAAGRSAPAKVVDRAAGRRSTASSPPASSSASAASAGVTPTSCASPCPPRTRTVKAERGVRPEPEGRDLLREPARPRRPGRRRRRSASLDRAHEERGRPHRRRRATWTATARMVEDLGVNQTPSIVVIGQPRQGAPDRGLRRRRVACPGSRGRAMSEKQGGPAPLRAVPERPPPPSAPPTSAERRADAAAAEGRRLALHLRRDRRDGLPAARARGRGGRGGQGDRPLARAGAARGGRDHRRPARARDRAALRALPRRPDRLQDRRRRAQPDQRAGGAPARRRPDRLRRRRAACSSRCRTRRTCSRSTTSS